MLDFVAKVFRGWLNALLWVILIGSAIGSFIVWGLVLGGWGFSFGAAVFGLLIGSLAGFVIVVLTGGLIAKFLNMVDDINSIKNYLLKNGSASGESSSGINLSNISPINPTVINPSDSWVCKKCGERNPSTASSCKDCGEYK